MTKAPNPLADTEKAEEGWDDPEETVAALDTELEDANDRSERSKSLEATTTPTKQGGDMGTTNNGDELRGTPEATPTPTRGR